MLQDGLTPLHLAVKKSFIKVTRALVSAGADVDSQDNAVSPTHLTVKNKRG